jgi:hypothetical protein
MEFLRILFRMSNVPEAPLQMEMQELMLAMVEERHAPVSDIVLK